MIFPVVHPNYYFDVIIYILTEPLLKTFVIFYKHYVVYPYVVVITVELSVSGKLQVRNRERVAFG